MKDKIYYKNLAIEIDRTPEFDHVAQVFGGHIFFQTLCAAIEFDLFTLLSRKGPLDIPSVAKELEIDEQPARILLMGLAAVKLLLVDSGDPIKYSNSKGAEVYYNGDSPLNIKQFVRLQKEVMYKGMPHFYESLKANHNLGLQAIPGDEETLYERLKHQPQVKQIFQDAMSELSSHANSDLVERVNMSEFGRILDVGGGDGSNMIQIVESQPGLSGGVFDLSIVTPITEKKVRDQGLQDRIQVIGGDCFKEGFPPGFDALLFSHFCTIWSPEENLTLYRRAHQALPEGGHVLVFNQMQASEGSGPLVAAIGSPYFQTIATGRGMLYSWKDYEDWLKEAGFSEIKRVDLPMYHGLLVAKK